MASRPKKEKGVSAGTVNIKFTQAEKQLLLKACAKYRYSIPAYLQSGQSEIEALDLVMTKLK